MKLSQDPPNRDLLELEVPEDESLFDLLESDKMAAARDALVTDKMAATLPMPRSHVISSPDHVIAVGTEFLMVTQSLTGFPFRCQFKAL